MWEILRIAEDRKFSSGDSIYAQAFGGLLQSFLQPVKVCAMYQVTKYSSVPDDRPVFLFLILIEPSY